MKNNLFNKLIKKSEKNIYLLDKSLLNNNKSFLKEQINKKCSINFKTTLITGGIISLIIIGTMIETKNLQETCNNINGKWNNYNSTCNVEGLKLGKEELNYFNSK